jgi:L-alanine-DL-glutamate epimerase-like enolase superfamily enzyme
MAAAIERLETFLFRVPLTTPRVNSFGKMTHRAALVVRLIDRDGVEGWGECFCNWPAFAAEHRYRILSDLIAPRLAGCRFAAPQDVTEFLTAAFRILRIQADEPGPFDQAIAAVDLAAWDLAARRAEQPLYRVLGAQHPCEAVPYYASGLSPDQAIRIAKREQELGGFAYKLKVGWGVQEDVASLSALRELIGPDAVLMVDANQKWTLPEAHAAIDAFRPFDLSWVEEPIPADHPSADFAQLAALGLPIAAGENIRGADRFHQMISDGKLSVVQPDIIKWGGLSGCWPVARAALEAGVRYCPHYLGGGIGLLATAHLLAAMGADGMLELDATPNTLRTLLADPFPVVSNGYFALPQGPGLGVRPDLERLAPYQSTP